VAQNTPIQPSFAEGIPGTVKADPAGGTGLTDLHGFSHIWLPRVWDGAAGQHDRDDDDGADHQRKAAHPGEATRRRSRDATVRTEPQPGKPASFEAPPGSRRRRFDEILSIMVDCT
jgi:hypothetical protein